jgi:hypothetical protein
MNVWGCVAQGAGGAGAGPVGTAATGKVSMSMITSAGRASSHLLVSYPLTSAAMDTCESTYETLKVKQ